MSATETDWKQEYDAEAARARAAEAVAGRMLKLLKDIEAEWPATTSILRERGRALIAEAERNGQTSK